MNKHEEVRKKLLVVTNYLAKLFEECPEEIGVLEDYITQAESTDKELEGLKEKHNELNKTVMMFQDLLKQGHFEDALEEVKKDGSAKVNRYNDGLYDVLNMVENWFLHHYSKVGEDK